MVTKKIDFKDGQLVAKIRVWGIFWKTVYVGNDISDAFYAIRTNIRNENKKH